MAQTPSPFLAAVKSAFTDKDGNLTWTAKKLFTDWDTRLTKGLNLIGEFIGQINASATISGRTEGIGTTVQNIDSTGVINGPGVDFSRAYVHKDTDHIADGTGSPLSGGATAYQALVASTPVVGQFLKFNGAHWTSIQANFTDIAGVATAAQVPSVGSLSGSVSPSQLPVPTVSSLGGVQASSPVSHKWVNSIDTSGIPQVSQPDFSDLSGAASAAQLPASVPVVSFGTGAPVAASTEGYQYFDTTGSPYHGYVYHGGAWHQFS